MAGTPRTSSRPSKLSHIGATLKEDRMTFGMTQEQVAKQFGVSLKSLRNLEQGRDGVSLSTTSQILKYFGKELRVGDIVISPARIKRKRPRLQPVLETLRMVKPVLETKFHVESLILFGSCARDQATNKSDIDLAVTFTESPTFSTLGRMTVFLETLFEGCKVDLVEKTKLIPDVLQTAKRDFVNV